MEEATTPQLLEDGTDIADDFIQFLEKIKSSTENRITKKIASIQKEIDSESDEKRKEQLIQVIELYKQSLSFDREINEKQTANIALAKKISILEKSLNLPK